MFKRATLLAVLLLSPTAARAAEPLASIASIRALGNSQAAASLPVRFEATVTYYSAFENAMFVQEGDHGIFVMPAHEVPVRAGDRVEVEGITAGSFRPIVDQARIVFLHHGGLPPAAPAGFDELMRIKRDSQLVSLRGVIRSADVEISQTVRSTRLQMSTDGGIVHLRMNSIDPAPLKDLLDAEVEVTGVAGGFFDGKMHATGVLLHVASLDGIRIVRRAQTIPWQLPLTPMDEIMGSYHERSLTRRVRVHGIVTYFQPGASLVLQSGEKSLWVLTQTNMPLRIGDEVDASGFPDVYNGFLTLTNSEIQPTAQHAPLAPRALSWAELASSHHIFDLVQSEGTLLMAVREASQDEYVLVKDGHLFSAVYRHPELEGFVSLAPMKEVPIGSKIRVSGICLQKSTRPFDNEVPFDILLRDFNDIEVVARPSLLNNRNLLSLIGLLMAALVAVSLRGWYLGRKMLRQTESAAALERQRSRILEEINTSKPLAEILARIAAMVSMQLRGAPPCWCEIAGGATVGERPAISDGLRIVCQEIPARTGPALGSLSAALPTDSQPTLQEAETIAAGVRLAALAIESQRLHADLYRRSEYDLLTDIHNRFSLERYLDSCIANAHQEARVFGLIYIDLDDFKHINDHYGHHIGDFFLQEVARRIKRQLRAQDMLARVGGDEFALLLPSVHSRAGVEEVAHRIVRGFDTPFAVEGLILSGSASLGIAMYPENGMSKDDLLRVADQAMYAEKFGKRIQRELAADASANATTESA